VVWGSAKPSAYEAVKGVRSLTVVELGLLKRKGRAVMAWIKTVMAWWMRSISLRRSPVVWVRVAAPVGVAV